MNLQTAIIALILPILPTAPTLSFAAQASENPKARSKINYQEGSFVHTAVDAEITTPQQVFQLRRSYNSRSLHSGLFGFGWCSDFEKHIDLRRSDQLKLSDCRLPSEIVFKKIKAGIYESTENPKDLIVLDKNQYLRKTRFSLQKFDSQGRLLSLSDHYGHHLTFFYAADELHSPDTLSRLSLDSSSQLRLKLDPTNRRILSVILSQRSQPELRLEYTYQGSNLASSTDWRRQKTTYSYDSFHNLTHIHYSDGASELMTYNQRHDWIESMTSENGCKERVSYTQGKRLTPDTTLSEIKCPSQPTRKMAHQFWYRTSIHGESHLAKSSHQLVLPTMSFNLSGGPANEP